ncbi:MAG: Smr/MutS family protein [Alphaproteobacteria bacterium]|nr:Smr/MutS family protein [Alphaproteobacteria bacterium]
MAKPRSRADTSEGDDAALWRHAMVDVAPLRGRALQARAAGPAAQPRANQPARPAAAPPPRPQRPAPAERAGRADPPLDRLAGIDRASAERLRRGRRPIEARLDLHSMTQAEAHAALSAFVERSRDAGRRCVLVITGRGSFGGGILKQSLPRWLADPGLRRHLLATAPAQPKHGGSGAVYLLLRRLRER